ncbi:MAG: signal recognition particle-docking protein FtsY [Hyphomicrobiales bacterium]|nr:signal recognition particle-docking protein FtsY [Hyphomicrobiales bacterium]MDE2018206.1 signal recognition particle-docking protein FtsY [Hyphomicrobiales bacterium]
MADDDEKPGLMGRLFGRAASPAPRVPAPSAPATKPPTWWSRLTRGLSRSSTALGQGVVDLFAKRKLDAATLDELEDALIAADLGPAAAKRVREALARDRHGRDASEADIREALAAEVERALTPVAKPLFVESAIRPFAILVVGVNGSGKTTTIGKLARKFVDEGRKVALVAGDTFRAAAIEQLGIWAARTGATLIAGKEGADPAGLAFEALTRAKAEGFDVLVMDTAGRLQNRAELMAELAKVVRVMKKVDPAAPHAVLLVLDATVGQNALSQVELFGKTAGVTGLAMTKLDGTARGGVLVALADRFGLPVHFIGVGETAEDFAPFSAKDFAAAIAGKGGDD